MRFWIFLSLTLAVFMVIYATWRKIQLYHALKHHLNPALPETVWQYVRQSSRINPVVLLEYTVQIYRFQKINHDTSPIQQKFKGRLNRLTYFLYLGYLLPWLSILIVALMEYA